MSVINTNVNAVLAQNALVKNERSMSSAMEQLSTGKRINGAKDDAAGLSIASKMTSQIRGLDQAVRNVNDAISMLQTAEGATVEITNMLQRMRELAVQSSSGTNNQDETDALSAEFEALKVGIDNIANTTQWNGVNIIDGTKKALSGSSNVAPVFQIGANDTQTLQVSMGDLSLNGYSGATQGTIVLTTDNTDATSLRDITVNGTVYTSSDIVAASTVNGLATALQGHTELASRYVITTNTTSTITFTERAGYESGAVLTLTTASLSNTSAAAGVTSVIGTRGLGSDLTNVRIGDSSVLATLDSSLRAVALQRGDFGAAMNRLEYTADNLANVSQNTQASRSRIEDADYAKATTELARTQIIQQAGTAMLAQANQQSQGVLALLQ